MERARNVGAFLDLPHEASFRDVSAAAGADRKPATGAPADRVDDAGIGHRARAHVPADAGRAAPEFRPRVGVEREDLLHHRNHELRLSGGQYGHERSVPRVVHAAGPPYLFARILPERDDRLALDARVDDDEVFVEDGGGGRAPAVQARAHRGRPEPLPFGVEREDASSAEENEDAAGVRDRSARGVAVVLADALLLGQLGRNRRVPESFPGRQVEAEDVSLELFHLASLLLRDGVSAVGRDVDPLADDDRARRSRTGESRLPRNVFLRSPLDGRLAARADALASRSTELGPVGS